VTSANLFIFFYRILFVKNLKYVPDHFAAFAPARFSGGSALQLAIYNRDRVADIFLNSYNVTAEQLFDLFGKFGPIR
jgi:hypothetical protein